MSSSGTPRNTRLGGARARASNRLVASQPALPPEPNAAVFDYVSILLLGGCWDEEEEEEEEEEGGRQGEKGGEKVPD